MTTLTRITHSVNPPRQCERPEDCFDYSEDDMTALLLFWAVVVLLLFGLLIWMDTHPEQLDAIINFGR